MSASDKQFVAISAHVAPGETDPTRENVYIIQFNTPSSRNLMPLAAGLLQSYAMADPQLSAHFNFKLEILRYEPEQMARSFDNPRVLAFSVYFWNFNQSVLVARWAKRLFPNVVIVFGGPSVPIFEAEVKEFFASHPYVDVVVPGEGEIRFANILRTLLKDGDLSEVEGISFRRADGTVVFQKKGPYSKDISCFPSPFLNGIFDELLDRHRADLTGVVLETNRGCPFSCTYCYWGALNAKVTQFPLERVFAELDWLSQRKIAYIYGGDANFGILKRDREIAKYMAKLNIATGYPRYFVINWTKNKTEGIFEILEALSGSDVQFMLTTSVQSFNEETLKAVKRQNIKLDHFNQIMEEAKRRNFQTYSELILGLPLESYESFADGIRKVLVPEYHFHFYIYYCVLIPGAEMSERESIEKYQIQTRRRVMSMVRAVHDPNTVQEFEDVVVSTSTMSIADWKRTHTLGYFTKALYGFRIAYFLLNYLRTEHGIDIVSLMEFMIERGRCDPRLRSFRKVLAVLSRYEDAILDCETNRAGEHVDASLLPDVAALLSILADKDGFYLDFDRCIRAYVECTGGSLNEEVYQEVFVYQFARTPTWNQRNRHVLRFDYNVHDSFTAGGALQRTECVLLVGEESSCETANDFLMAYVHRDMVVSLLDVEVGLRAESLDARELYRSKFGRWLDVEGEAERQCVDVAVFSR